MQNRPIISTTIRAKDNEARANLQYILTDLAKLRADIRITTIADEPQVILGAMMNVVSKVSAEFCVPADLTWILATQQ